MSGGVGGAGPPGDGAVSAGGGAASDLAVWILQSDGSRRTGSPLKPLKNQTITLLLCDKVHVCFYPPGVYDMLFMNRI